MPGEVSRSFDGPKDGGPLLPPWETEKAINFLRSEGYSVFARSGCEPGIIYLIRFHKNDGSLSYNVRRHRKGLKDDYYGNKSEIAKIKLEDLKWEPMSHEQNDKPRR